MTQTLLAIGLTWIAGAVVVGWSWPRHEALPRLARLGLAGVLGPATVGVLLLGAGLCGASPALARHGIAGAILVAGAFETWRVTRRPRASAAAAGAGLTVVLLLAVAGTTTIAMRTHLGWDGTVVWYHKARIITASGGVLPRSAVADRTRAWTAPDYPLQVPLAMAWVRAWQPAEDEHALKLLPAAWCAALLCLLAAAVLEQGDGRPHARALAGAAVLVAATTPRLLVGEGSLTSGYADGPLAAFLLALIWIGGRGGWGAAVEWRPLLTLIALGTAWTKQEGLVMVAVVALGALTSPAVSLWRVAQWVGPAALAAVSWLAWVAHAEAPLTMAYAWPGTAEAVRRVPLILRAYVGEGLDLRVWGLFWPGLLVMAAVHGRALWRRESFMVAAIVTAGASAFLVSGWPDVREHLAVTVPRQLVQVTPALVWLAIGAQRVVRRGA